MAVYDKPGSAMQTGFLESAFLPAIIVLVLICIFLNPKRDCKIIQSDWPKFLALEIPEHSTIAYEHYY